MITCYNCREKGVDIDHVLVDGYGFGDRLLEGVMFEIREENGDLTAKVQDRDKGYFEELNQELWLKRAVEDAKGNDIFTCPKCRADLVLEWDEDRGEFKVYEDDIANG